MNLIYLLYRELKKSIRIDTPDFKCCLFFINIKNFYLFYELIALILLLQFKGSLEEL